MSIILIFFKIDSLAFNTFVPLTVLLVKVTKTSYLI